MRTWIFVFCAAAGSTMLAAVGVAAPIDCANIATSTGPVPPELVAACGGQAVEGHHPRFAPTDLAVSPDAALTQCSSMVLNDGLLLIEDDQPYTVVLGFCPFSPERAGLPSSTGVEQ